MLKHKTMICALLGSNSDILLYKNLLCFFLKQQRCLKIKNHPVKRKMAFKANVQAKKDDTVKNNPNSIIKLSTLYIHSPIHGFSLFIHLALVPPTRVGVPDGEHLFQSDWQTLSLAVATTSAVPFSVGGERKATQQRNKLSAPTAKP